MKSLKLNSKAMNTPMPVNILQEHYCGSKFRFNGFLGHILRRFALIGKHNILISPHTKANEIWSEEIMDLYWYLSV